MSDSSQPHPFSLEAIAPKSDGAQYTIVTKMRQQKALQLALQLIKDGVKFKVASDPNIIGGQFRAQGTRISVAQFYEDYLKGQEPSKIASSYQGVSLGVVIHAIAFAARYESLIAAERLYRAQLDFYQTRILDEIEG